MWIYEPATCQQNHGADQTANGLVEVELENGAKLESKTVILSTGHVGENECTGEAEYRTRGVAYCHM
ncbi:NADH dehydrogenase domain protein [Acinetobacter baumannii WC-692]|nr:NADH dehydrogenase domain protein [Acinetobacter baumannii WC-692]